MNKQVQQVVTKSESIREMLIKSQSQIQSAINYIDQQATRDEKIKQVLQHAVDRFVEITDKGVLPSPQEIRLIKSTPKDDPAKDILREKYLDQEPEIYEENSNPQANAGAHQKNPKEDSKKDPKQKEIGLLRMQIQNLLFAKTGEPEHIEAILKDVSLKCKCSMGHMFLTVQDLATCENVAWMKEITDSLGQMK
jgi:hypothetical protein